MQTAWLGFSEGFHAHKLVLMVSGKMSTEDYSRLKNECTLAPVELTSGWLTGCADVGIYIMGSCPGALLCFFLPNLWPTHARPTHIFYCLLGYPNSLLALQFPHVYISSVCQPFWKTFPFGTNNKCSLAWYKKEGTIVTCFAFSFFSFFPLPFPDTRGEKVH